MELLSRRERYQLLLLVGIVVLTAVLEVINVGVISPFLSAASDPASIHQNKILSFLYQRAGFDGEVEFLVYFGIAVFALMVVSNAIIMVATWMQYRFAWSWNHRISTRLLRRYLYQPYSYFLTRNSADLSKNILSEVEQLTNQFLVPTVLAVGRGVIAVGIIALLIATEPMFAFLVTVVVGGSYGLIYSRVRRKLRSIGDDRLRANRERFTVASEALGGIKDVKILCKEDVFYQRFVGPSERFSRGQATAQAIGQLPRYAVEAVAFGTILFITLYVMSTDGNLTRAISILGLYTFAGYRLMPAVQQVFRAITQARYYAPALKTLLDELQEQAGAETESLSSSSPLDLALQKAIEFRNVSFSYPGSEREAVANLSLTIRARTMVGIVGVTGSGKTTVADLLLGLLRPTSGEILVDGIPITPENVRAWQRRIGYVPQQIFLSDATIAENIAFGVPAHEIDLDAVRHAAKIANLDRFVTSELPQGYDTVVGERGVRLSGGQRQRLGIARALYHNPDILVFDEATSALDNATENAVMEAIHSLLGKKTIVLIAHRLTSLRDCDEIYMLASGALVAKGTYDELIRGRGRFAEVAPVLQRIERS